MRAITVSVNFSDLLDLTMSRNRKHFSDVLVVTDLQDDATVKVAERLNCKVFRTDAFTRNGAYLNKWAALEEGLDAFGRHGWLTHLDADVIWPEDIHLAEKPTSGLGDPVLDILSETYGGTRVRIGQLCSPLRRMLYRPDFGIPPEKDWELLPIHRNQAEWAGYSQIYHASDPVLGSPPWHDISWQHAGGADSFWQRKWKPENKIRPPWAVLHVGSAGENWMGRVTPRLDGTKVEGAEERQQQVNQMWFERRAREAQVRAGTLPKEQLFDAEKVRPEG